MPSTSLAASIAQSISRNAAANPLNGKPASDFHATQNTAYPTKTSVLTSDTYYAYAGSASAANLVEYGFQSADSLKNTISYAYATPQVVAELPFAQNAGWSNSAAVAISETDADGTTSTRTYNADGSYTDTEKFFYGDADITQNADGSGIYTSPVFLSGLLGAEQTFRFDAPSNGQIVVTGEFPPPPTPTPNATGQPTPTPNPTIAPTIVTIPAWYAAGQKLYTETDTDGGSPPFPRDCSVPAKIGSQGEKLVQTISRLDTILGFAETQTTTSYVVPNFGPACIVMNDVTKDYYDYQGDTLPGQNTTGFFAYYSAPYHTTTIDETLTLQSATIRIRRAYDREFEHRADRSGSRRGRTNRIFVGYRAPSPLAREGVYHRGSPLYRTQGGAEMIKPAKGIASFALALSVAALTACGGGGGGMSSALPKPASTPYDGPAGLKNLAGDRAI